ncbi:MAG: AI-2E family transporter [Desulfobacterales bacterium]|nr:AI-2E family transporter [Desulfobacterales bacterium]
MKEKLNISHYFLFVLIFASIFLCYKMINIYLNPIIFGLILAILAKPLYERVLKKVKGRTNLASGILCILLIVVIVLPFMILFSLVIKQGIISFNAITDWVMVGNLEKFAQLYEKYLPETGFLNDIDMKATITNLSTNSGKFLIQKSGTIVGNITAVFINFGLMIFVFFFVIQNEKKLFDYIFHLIPLSKDHETILIDKIKAVSKSAILGTLVTAAGQGVAGGIAFAVCGLPGFFWGTVMGFASLIPVVGTALVWIPAAIYLFIAGNIKSGVFMIIWSVVIVGMIDNFVRPLFMSGSANMSTIVIFFSILGGLNLFGLAGLLYGPLIFAITMVLFYIYELEFTVFLKDQDNKKQTKETTL